LLGRAAPDHDGVNGRNIADIGFDFSGADDEGLPQLE
jgi:hypothetical protein